MPVSDIYVVEGATGEWVVSRRWRITKNCMALWRSHERWHIAGVCGSLFSCRMAAGAAMLAPR
jgi:hypothetical protein